MLSFQGLTMSFRTKTTGISIVFLAMLCALAGCASPFYNLSWLATNGAGIGENPDYYVDKATKIAYPDITQETDERVFSSKRPRSLRSRSHDEVWDLHLAEAIRLALKNSSFIRDRAQFLSPGNPILNNSAVAQSKYDVALQESSVVTGRRGVDAALADFDGRFITSLIWGRNETVQNNRFQSGGLTPGDVLSDETASYSSTLEKQLADGSDFSIVNDWNYSLNNIPSRLFGSVYTGSLRFNYTRPLWAASGTRFTRIAGHPGRNATTALNVDNGVVIARINGDISVANFEAAVAIMLRDVETLYWDLYLAYQTYHTQAMARERAAEVWSKIKADSEVGRTAIYNEAQARDNYHDAKDRAQNALADIYSTELQLRRLLGLAVNDGRVIRPADTLQTTELIPDWDSSLIEALSGRVELRRQKWNIKSLQLQLEAAQSLTHPRVDLVTEYRLNAFGDHFFAGSDNDGVTRAGFNNAVETLFQGNHTGWQLGFRGSWPIGFRQARTQVRNIELRLAKAKKALSEQELEISHELSNSFQQLDRWYASAKTNYNRLEAARDRLEAYRTLLDSPPKGADPLDAVVRAQFSFSQAKTAYLRSVTEYNKAIADLYYRTGGIFRRYHVILEEDEWDPQAYEDVLRRAWSRTHAFEEESTLRTEPLEFETDRSSTIEIPGENDPAENFNFDKPGKILPPAPTIEESQSEIEKITLENARTPSTLLSEPVTIEKNAVGESDPTSRSAPLVFPRRQNYRIKPQENEPTPRWLQEIDRRDQSSRRWNIPQYPNPATHQK